MSVFDRVKSQISTWHVADETQPLPGLYAYLRENPGEKSRIHLRIDPDGMGMLMVNAARVYHLNPTAATMAYFHLENYSDDLAIRCLTEKFSLSKQQAKADYLDTSAQVDALIRPDGPCPIHDLELETTLPFSARPTAPYRMDLAITYRCNNNCSHCYNARPRSSPELTTTRWIEILDRLWELRIPHIIFTGGEPTLREDLTELIAHAEKNGQITGLNTNGRQLADPEYLKKLQDAGLDHVQITLESHSPDIHDQMVRARGAWQQTVAGLQNALNSRLYVMTNTTLLSENSPGLADTVDFLASRGVPTVGLNALIYSGRGSTVGSGLPESQLPSYLALAREKTQEHGQKLIWYTPTEYCHFDPVLLELGVKGCTAALYNMCVEPDGSVIPCQSYYHRLGNIMDDPWESIWDHDLSVSLRERRNLPGKCLSCALMPECGGGCPLARSHQEQR